MKDHHRTSTGIISPLPPPKQSAYVPLATSTSSIVGGINQSALAMAKVEAARRQLYSGFLRGSVLGSSLEEEEKEMERAAEEKLKGKGKEVGGKGKGKSVEREKNQKRKRSKGEEKEEDSDGEVKLSKEERRAAKKQRKENRAVVASLPPVTISTESTSTEEDTVVLSKKTKKSKLKSTEDDSSRPTKSKRHKSEAMRDHLSPEEEIAVDEVAYAEAREIAKRAIKEEKRLAKVVKRALKEGK